mmetsp:Transcript_113049/g.200407  ORF Transcript_113049/g.200407 Transcript_113049/m.200407 type:complete len:223 (+) Transcript_113049:987-1655(+)
MSDPADTRHVYKPSSCATAPLSTKRGRSARRNGHPSLNHWYCNLVPLKLIASQTKVVVPAPTSKPVAGWSTISGRPLCSACAEATFSRTSFDSGLPFASEMANFLRTALLARPLSTLKAEIALVSADIAHEGQLKLSASPFNSLHSAHGRAGIGQSTAGSADACPRDPSSLMSEISPGGQLAASGDSAALLLSRERQIELSEKPWGRDVPKYQHGAAPNFAE